MRTASLILALLCCAAGPAADKLIVGVAPADKDRRWVLVEFDAQGKPLPGLGVTDEKGAACAAQRTAKGIAWVVPFIAAGEKKKFTIDENVSKGGHGAQWTESSPGIWSLQNQGKEITRYNTGAYTEQFKHHKNFFWPLVGHGVNFLRGWPMEEKAGEAIDHPHHTGMYFAFGEVNGKEYWSKLPLTSKKFSKEAGPAFAQILAENAWGEDLVENDDVRIMTNPEGDTVVDWVITLTAANGPVVFAKDLKMAKEGAFAIRVAKELSLAKGDGPDMIVDSKGNKGEKLARENAAPWVDYTGQIDGKKVGIAVMNHPTSWRYPSDWHVRAYGLFAANPWIIKGENTLQKGESLTLKWRVYLHEGDAAKGKVADVFAGYAEATAKAE